jgi:hypothetical protein
MITEVSASDLLILEDTVSSNMKAETLEDALNFNEGVFSNFKYGSAEDRIGFHDYAVPIGNTVYLRISESLTFTDATQPRVHVRTISDFLFMWDVVKQPMAGVIHDSFVLTEGVVFTNSKLVGPDVMSFSETLGLHLVARRSPSDSLAFSDSVSIVVINRLSPYLPQ